MREHIYRGKRIDNGEWILESETYIKDGDGVWLSDENCNVVKVYPDTVGEFTGLLDKNGARVFEGDIINYKSMNLQVRWDNEKAGFFIGKDKYWMMNDCELEVVGNIFDNPELAL